MSNIAFGIIHDYYPMSKMISIKERNRVSYYYFSKSSSKVFEEAMEHKSVFIEFEYGDKIKYIRKTEAHEITSLKRVAYQSPQGLIEMFSQTDFQKTISSYINEKRYKMFMDLEMSMPSFGDKNKFIPEVIQIGAVITDENDEIINYYTNYVHPTKKLTDRTKRFLYIDEVNFVDAVTYDEFYADYKELIDIYNPIIYVWGGNDIKALDDSYKMHNVEPIKAEYADLCKFHRTYFGLKTDLGLFNALKIYREIDADQAHHALTDAQATKEVFDGFKSVVNGLKDVEIKKQSISE